MPRGERGTQKVGAIWEIYGPSGEGKTLLAAAFAEVMAERYGKPVLYADWDFFSESTIHPRVNLIPWFPGEGDPEDESFSMLAEAEKDDVSGLIVDTISTLGDRITSSVSSRNIKSDKDKATARPGYITAEGRAVNGRSMADYGIAQSGWLSNWIAAHGNIVRQGKIVLWVAHQTVNQIELPSGRKYSVGGPRMISRAMTEEMPKYAQVYLRLETIPKPDGEAERVLRCNGDGLFIAKDRLMALPQRGIPLTVKRAPGMKPEDFQAAILDHGKKVWQDVFEGFDRINGRREK